MTIIERVKSFEDACEVLNISAAIPDFSAMPEAYQKPLLAHYKLCIICEALNEGKTADWQNGEWDKWYPWFDMDDSSSSGRFSFTCSDNWDSISDVGSRLCYKTRQLADYAGRQFEDLYREYFVIVK